jgi:hypothetical protein
MIKFVVNVNYSGSLTYNVEAPNVEQAQKVARELFENGQPSSGDESWELSGMSVDALGPEGEFEEGEGVAAAG